MQSFSLDLSKSVSIRWIPAYNPLSTIIYYPEVNWAWFGKYNYKLSSHIDHLQPKAVALSPGSLWQVEMFVICTPEQSEALLGELVELELSLFTDLGLHFKVLDMPTADLGAPAYRKIDFEVNGRSPPPFPLPITCMCMISWLASFCY